jgi:hypothetical protein
MALRKNLKYHTNSMILDLPDDSDLPSRIERISEQTGLDASNLFQKWVLQEESLIGLIQHSKGQRERTAKKEETRSEVSRKRGPGARMQKETVENASPNGPEYREMLAAKAIQLRQEGATLKKVAETFNEENLPTVSGVGKWYASSITWLINIKS